MSPRLQPYVSAGAHICVNHGVSADLDALRTDSNPSSSPSPNSGPSISPNPYPCFTPHQALRTDYRQMENVLTDAAQYEPATCNPTCPNCNPASPACSPTHALLPRYELARLRTVGLMAGGADLGEELFVIYVPQVSQPVSK